MRNEVRCGGGWKRDNERWRRETLEREKHKYYCSCGHSVLIPYDRDKKMCNWCKHWVYKDDRRFFKDKMRQLLNRKEGVKNEGESKNGR